MVFIFKFSKIRSLILLSCLIILKIIYINSLEINSKYPHCLVLSNKNILIVHETGISMYDSSLENNIYDYNFESNDILTSDVLGATISIFQETESTVSYVFILAKNILYIIPTVEDELTFQEDLNNYLIDLTTSYNYYYYTFLFYKLDNSDYYFFIIYPDSQNTENGIILKLFSFNKENDEVSLINSLTYQDKDSGTTYFISNRGVTCQIMNSNTFGKILVCFYKIDWPVKLKVVAFTVDSENNIIPLEDIKLYSQNNENKQAYIKSSVSSDKKKALICYSGYDPNNYSIFASFCLTFDIDSLTLGDEIKYDDNCGRSPDFINTFYFEETKEFAFICLKNENSIVKYKIVKYDSDLNAIAINSDEEYFAFENCNYAYSFSLIYILNQYILLNDAQCGTYNNIIKSYALPEDYQASSSYFNSNSISKATTSFKYSLSSVISSTPSTISSSSPMSTIISSSLKKPSTSIPTTISSSTYPFYSTLMKSSEIKTTIITTFLSTSHLSSTEIKKTSSLYSSHSSIPSSTLITSPESTNFIPNHSSSSIITSEIPSTIYTSSITSTTITNKIESTIPKYTYISTSSSENIKSSIISYPSSDIKSYSFSTSLESFPSSTSLIKESNKFTTHLSSIFLTNSIITSLSSTNPKTSTFTSLSSTSPKIITFSSSLIISSNLKLDKRDELTSVPSTTESNINNTLIECDIISNEKKILYNNCFMNFIKYNLNQIEGLGKDGLIINKVSDSNIYLYELEANIEETEYNNKSLIFIQNLKLKKDLINEYNLNESEKIYILIVESPSENENSAINDYDFTFISENGTILNLSELNSDLNYTISIPIKTLDLVNYEYAVYFSEFGYDIYKKNDIFYNNICSSAYIYNNDIVINDRKKYIYPNNVSLCFNYCLYEISDLVDKRILCNCNLNINDKSNYNEKNYFEIEEDDNNFFNYLLDMINYEIYKCYSLLFSFGNYRKKIVFYALILILIVYIILIIRFFAYRIFCIRIAIINNIKKAKKSLLLKSIKNMKSFINKANPVKHKTKRIENSAQTNMIFQNVNIYMPIKIKKSKIKIVSNKSIKRKSKRNLSVKVTSISNRMKIDDNDYNDLPYNKAIIYDKRDFIKTFTSVVIDKIELMSIFSNNKTLVKELLLCQYILSLLVDFYFNTILYSDDIISHKYHNEGKLDLALSLLLSLSSNIITSIILHYTSYLKGLEEKLEMIMEIKINVIKRIQFIEVTNANGMKVTFSNLGASILSIIYGDKMMTSSPKHFNDFSRHDIYHGKTIGQIAGRVKEGKVVINGKEYQMDKNEGENTLHGGTLGISNVPWDIQRFHKDNVFTVIYSFRKKKKFAYLPGTVTYYVGYTIKDDEDKIYMTYKVFSDEDTVVSITNHTFFCLGEEDAKNLYLTLKSDTFAIPNDETLLFEQFKKVNEVMDFRKKKRIGKHIDDSSIADVRARGYDHYYLFNKDYFKGTI